MASSSAAAKRDHAVTVPPPPPKKGSNNKTAPSSSSCNQRYASHIKKVSSNPTSNTEAIGVGTTSPIPSEQVVTRLWSKGAVVKQINAVQDEYAKKRPSPAHFGVRSPQISTRIECSHCYWYDQVTHQFCCSHCINLNLPEELC